MSVAVGPVFGLALQSGAHGNLKKNTLMAAVRLLPVPAADVVPLKTWQSASR
jgi:hypothetical protein